MGEGGAVLTNNDELLPIAESFVIEEIVIVNQEKIIRAAKDFVGSLEICQKVMIINIFTVISDIISKLQICRLLAGVHKLKNCLILSKKENQILNI